MKRERERETNPKFHSFCELPNEPVFLLLGDGDADHGNDEEPLDRSEELPSHGFGSAQAYSFSRAGFLGVDEPPLE